MHKLRIIILLASFGLASACGGGGAEERDRAAPLVTVDAASTMRFVETIDAVGTARANEQVTLAAPVTERIVRLNFEDGDFVTRGQTIAVLAVSEENAQLNEAQARAREAGQQLDRVEALRERGFATQSSLDAQAALAAQARAAAAGAQAQIGDRIVEAPFSGWVSLRNISRGAVVSAGDEIVTISDVSPIKLDFAVPETMLSAIRPGQSIVATAAAWPDQPFRGQIDTIAPVIDPATRAVTVRAMIPNPDRKLKPGMLLTVAIETEPRTSLSVPELAVIGEGDARFVFVVGEDGVARRTEVRTGLRSQGRIEILDGLRPGQQVVTEGVVKLTDGMKVRLAGPKNAEPPGVGRTAKGG